MIDYSFSNIHISVIKQIQNSPQDSAFPAEIFRTLVSRR
jgi:hypothetical protein